MVQPKLILGSGMWGWTIEQRTAFDMLDTFYAEGFREIDSATNYPLDGNPLHWRLAENWLQKWIKANGIKDLKIIMKVGSLTNIRSPYYNLTQSFLLLNLDDYQAKFDSNLHTFMIHWDNRQQSDEIADTLEAFVEVQNRNLKIGLSGIKYPAIYAALNKDYQFDFRIECKHNLLESDYTRYVPFHGQSHFLWYGINARGLKLNQSQYTIQSSVSQRISDITQYDNSLTLLLDVIQAINQKYTPINLDSFYQIGMLNAFYSQDTEGIVLGTSSKKQLQQSISFYRELQRKPLYAEIYREIEQSVKRVLFIGNS